MFDDTYKRIPSEGWMFLPLVNYGGGGSVARFEPLKQHKTEYDFAFAQYFGAGVQGKIISKGCQKNLGFIAYIFIDSLQVNYF